MVVSAAGKRFSGDNKITDLLLLVNAHVQYHVDCTALLADIQRRFQDIVDELGLKWPVAEKFEAFARNIKKHSPEYVVSRGEWFTLGFPSSMPPTSWSSTTTAPSTWSAPPSA